ncbi:MAG: hypothetical protein QME81_10025, partial [bacterium]|nr:hypothetical protein [bacterium]
LYNTQFGQALLAETMNKAPLHIEPVDKSSGLYTSLFTQQFQLSRWDLVVCVAYFPSVNWWAIFIWPLMGPGE